MNAFANPIWRPDRMPSINRLRQQLDDLGCSSSPYGRSSDLWYARSGSFEHASVYQLLLPPESLYPIDLRAIIGARHNRDPNRPMASTAAALIVDTGHATLADCPATMFFHFAAKSGSLADGHMSVATEQVRILHRPVQLIFSLFVNLVARHVSLHPPGPSVIPPPGIIHFLVSERPELLNKRAANHWYILVYIVDVEAVVLL